MNRAHVLSDRSIEDLLADPAHAGHPLHSALGELWNEHQWLIRRMDRITRVSDNVQALARRRELSRGQQLEKQLRLLEKVTRISDRYQDMMRELNLQLVQASTHDLLTGLPNRRLLGDRLKAEAERSDRREGMFCVAVVDVDHFKQVNDRHGHEAGDHVLTAVAQAMAGALREYDVCGRWGGEEFLVILPDVRLEQAACVIERLRAAVRALRFDADAEGLQVTVSVGLAEHGFGETADQAVSRADTALLQAKRAGRDRLVAADQPV